MKEADIIVSADLMITMNRNFDVIEAGALCVKGDQIAAVGKRDEVSRLFTAPRSIDGRGCVLIPGLINAHTHAPMTIFRGLADDLPLMEWLENYIFPVEAHLRPSWVRWGARLACAEMLLSGTTTFCDMYLFADEVASAARDLGIRALVGEVLYDFPSPNYGPIEEGFRYTDELIRKWRGDELISVAVQPHAPFTCSPELLKRARSLADTHDVPLIIHLAETQCECRQIEDRYGRSPVAHLNTLGIFSGETIADHVVWVDDEDLDTLAQRAVSVVHNPESNMKLASGVAPVPRMLEMGMVVGLGTDGCASNNDLDLFREMDSASKLHKAFALDPTVLDARTVLSMATSMGARALHMEGLIGSLEVGKKADFVMLGLDSPRLIPLLNPYSQIVYAAQGSDVRLVCVNGRVVVEDGRLLSFDLDEILSQIESISREIIQMTSRGGNAP
jgi:5-methylthioadenosine/S-adenosylhomocysteine deaminase